MKLIAQSGQKLFNKDDEGGGLSMIVPFTFLGWSVISL